MLKKLPIGISTLKDILKEDYIYIDKTKLALELMQNGRYYFLSRPRRFGKSLFLDTLKSIFEGDKELFRGLYIYDKYDFESHPIIRINFNDGNFSTKESFAKSVMKTLEENQQRLELTCEDSDVSFCFQELIFKAYKKYNKKVVILIDEYDKPILDNIENTEVARARRDDLKHFYSIIKGSDEYIKFVFITGVSKFSKVSLFSGLNNIQDITLHPKYSTICGYTQEDLENDFKEHLKGQDLDRIKLWYNGYKFLGQSVYNPFDILLLISNNFLYRNYWFSTATPTFLLKIMEKNNYFLPNLEHIIKDDMMLDSFDVDFIELETLMWQTGYLTITKHFDTPKGVRYKLGIPNKEVKVSLMTSIADYLSKIQSSVLVNDNILYAFLEQDFTKLQTNIKALFASIPYNLFTKNKLYEYEGYFVSVFYAYMKALGFDLVAEDITNKGRIDLSIKTDDSIYIIEFKVDDSTALKQIKDKNYHEKYLSEDKNIYLLGIEFSSKDRNIAKIEYEKMDKI